MSILTLATDAADELSLQRPSTLFATYDEGDTTDRKLLRALHKTCRFLAASFDWEVLKVDFAWVSTAAEVQAAALPADMLRPIIGTSWDIDMKRPLCGPLSDEEWTAAKRGLIPGLEQRYSIRGGSLVMNPVPQANRNFAFNYVRDAVGKSAAGAFKARFDADTDTPLWDDELVTLGVIYQFRKAEREEYAPDERDFVLMMKDRIKRDGGGQVLHMGGKKEEDRAAQMKSAAVFLDPSQNIDGGGP